MKLMLVADCVGGVFSYALELADALHARGIDIVLAVMGAELQPGQRAELQRRPWLACEARPFRLLWMPDAWADVRAARSWLLQLCARHRPDIVQLNDYGHVRLPWPVPVVLVLHSCVSTWFAAVHGTAPPPQFDRYRTVVRDAAAAADLVVAPTAAMLRAFVHEYGPCPQARVIANGIDQRQLRPRRRGRFVAAVGRVWDAAKNLEQLARVAPSLPAPVLIAGAQRLGDEQRGSGWRGARLLGELPRARVRAMLARASILAHPARYEPFGLAPLEAAAAGCALVLADIPNLREIWGAAATFVAADDADAWRLELQRLLHDDDRRRRLAAAARRRAKVFTAARMARSYSAAYRQLLRCRAAAIS